MSPERAGFSCPACGASAIFRDKHTAGTYRCRECGEWTDVESDGDAEESESDESDGTVDDMAELLFGGGDR